MEAVQSVAVPFVQIGNRRALTFEQLASDSELAAFVKRFPDSWERDIAKMAMLFIEPAPVT